jgi:hypothetical protein
MEGSSEVADEVIGRPRTSFQVDCWVEPRGVPALPALLRGSVRDLADGTQRFIGGLEDLDAFLSERLAAHGFPAAVWQADADRGT